jgi:hypothetical protein
MKDSVKIMKANGMYLILNFSGKYLCFSGLFYELYFEWV